MATITLNQTRVYEKNPTTNWWRDVECAPQTVELKTWASNQPYFVFSGIIVNSHDKSEIGKKAEIHNQSYEFWLNDMISEGIYTKN